MKYYYKLICVTILCVAGMSCKKYLDVVPNNVGTLDYAFSNRNEAENYLFGCYNTYQNITRGTVDNPGFTTTGEIYYPNLDGNPFNKIPSTGFSLIRNIQNTGSPVLDFWNGGNGGQNIYQAIRRCNIMLENIDKPIDLSEPEKRRWIAEIKFLKAFYHYYMIRFYGPVVLAKVNRPIDGPIEDTKVKRAPVDESFDYVTSLLDESIPDLPPVITNRINELGRITKSMAMAIKAEVLTTQASPLFNGNPDYAGFKDKDGRNLFSTTADPAKWEKAAAACKAAIVEFELRGGKLYTEVPTNQVESASDEIKKLLTLQNAVTQKWEQNPELVIASQFDFDYQGYAMPKLTTAAVAQSNDQPSNFSVPISTAELFYTKNGVPINEDKTWDYGGRNTVKAGDDANKHYIKLGYEAVKSHFDREPRFYADIAFDGAIWFGNDKRKEEEAYVVQGRGPAAIAGPKSLFATNVTGYWPKKLANYLTVMDVGSPKFEGFRLPIIRLSGLYLLYAEALNESLPVPSEEVYTYIDKVRQRAGLQGVRQSWETYAKDANAPSDKNKLRAIIHRERRIELCFEGQIGWDLRRWKELQDVLSRPFQGWTVSQANAVEYYRPQTVAIPVFGVKDYLWPIKNSEVVINENLVQNPFW